MYAGIDVGGTKTLVAVLDKHGVITEQIKFPTPQNYHDFGDELAKALADLKNQDFEAAAIGIPATVLNRHTGVGVTFGNLAWHNVPVLADVEKRLHCPVYLENDAKLAGLSEAMLLKKYSKVLYVTVSTGIGTALIQDGIIDTAFGDAGGRALLLEHHGKRVPWESFASGKAIYEKYGKPARELDDKNAWQLAARNIAQGMIELIALTEPDIIVIGGSIGTYYDKYKTYLKAALKAYEMPLVAIPPIVGAQRPEEAVVYGCYDLIKTHRRVAAQAQGSN